MYMQGCEIMGSKRQLYIVLSQTGTIISTMLKAVTGAKYNHVSISLTPDLEQMYSFARLKTNMPFPGGLVKESLDGGVFKKFENTKAVIIAVDLDEDKYKEVGEYISDKYSRKGTYKYNYLGVLMAPLKKNISRNNCFYCSEFVKHILQKGCVDGAQMLPDIIHPMDFLDLPHREIYNGILKEYDRNLMEVV